MWFPYQYVLALRPTGRSEWVRVVSDFFHASLNQNFLAAQDGGHFEWHHRSHGKGQGSHYNLTYEEGDHQIIITTVRTFLQ